MIQFSCLSMLCCASLGGLYTNDLKNRDFDKEAPQNFRLERGTIAEGQGASEDENSEVKPTLSKTDSSGCLCIELSQSQLQSITQKIWQNECAGRKEGLTSWNAGEEFASLGIGHFIWYPEKKKGRFTETFPELLLFLQENGKTLPAWLAQAMGAPWKNREEFESALHTSKTCELRDFLYNTQELQTLFLIRRLERALPQMVMGLPDKDKQQVEALFSRLTKDFRGVYALLDYLNFKGEGTSPSECYQGKGWGLLQVLSEMPLESVDPVAEFGKAAALVLRRRVSNAPKERGEERWLHGWLKRVGSY